MKANPKKRFLSYTFLLSSPNINWHSMVRQRSISQAFATNRLTFLATDWDIEIGRSRSCNPSTRKGAGVNPSRAILYIRHCPPLIIRGPASLAHISSMNSLNFPWICYLIIPHPETPNRAAKLPMIAWEDLAGFPYMKFCVFNLSIDPSGHYTNQNDCTYRLW